MTDHALLARVDAWLHLHEDATDDPQPSETETLIRDLRAALATRPQPDRGELISEFHEALDMDLGMHWDVARDAAEVCVDRLLSLRASAGSATPTEDTEGIEGLVASIEAEADIIAEDGGTYSADDVVRILRALIPVAVAGSATPTCQRCGGTGLVSLSGRGSDGPDPCPDCGPEIEDEPLDRWLSPSFKGSATPTQETDDG
jgi:hypothetical protein